MKRLSLLLISMLFILMTAMPAHANNIQVTDVTLVKNADQPQGTIDIRFDVTWENSFTGSDRNGNAFFDRAWIFVKYWNNSWPNDNQHGWKHAIISTGGNLTGYSMSSHTGIPTGGVGAFVKPGNSQSVRWTLPGDIVSTDTYKVRVMAIEMVYITQGEFYVGDGSTTNIAGQFCGNAAGTSPFKITGEGALTLGGASGNIYNNNKTGMCPTLTSPFVSPDDFDNGTSPAPTLPAPFPKGYNGFYIMKYEISQGQYRDFLNMLPRVAQIVRTATQTPNLYAMSGSAAPDSRNGIRVPASVPGTGTITFLCDLSNNSGASNNGESIACNYLSWQDLCAYSDWAGLRPMTELEFEKAGRGVCGPAGSVVMPTPNEYAWGDTTISSLVNVANSGANNELSSTVGVNCCSGTNLIMGPARCGIFATAGSTRRGAGASYYGVMELSGNVMESMVRVGNVAGRLFTGSNGDGTLTATGFAENADWPGIDVVSSSNGVIGYDGSCMRGGSFTDINPLSRTSDRYYADFPNNIRLYTAGGRLVRKEAT